MLVDPLPKNALWLNCERHFGVGVPVILVCNAKFERSKPRYNATCLLKCANVPGSQDAKSLRQLCRDALGETLGATVSRSRLGNAPEIRRVYDRAIVAYIKDLRGIRYSVRLKAESYLLIQAKVQ
jgi:hypothetical protein